LVKLKEDRSILRFNDIDKISSIYCDYIYKEKGKTLKRDLKSRRDNFLKIMVQLENDGLLQNVGSGKDYGKEFLKYAVKGHWHPKFLLLISIKYTCGIFNFIFWPVCRV
jgi:hypothetical protein